MTAPFSLTATAGSWYSQPVAVGATANFTLTGSAGGPIIPVTLPVTVPYSAPFVPATYTFILCDPQTGEDIAELTDATARSVSVKLKSPSEARFRLSIYSDQAELISPLGTGLKVYRNDFLVMRGIVGPTSGTIAEGNKHDIEYAAIDYRGALKRYQLWTEDAAVNKGYTEDAEAVGWYYIDTVQKRLPSLNIVRGGGGAVGVTSFWRAEANDTVMDAIDKIASSGSTFDWDIVDVDGRMTWVAWPARGVENSYALDPGGSVLTCTYTYNPETYANVVRVLGAGGLTATSYSQALDGSPVGAWSTSLSDDSLKTIDMVNARAAGALKEMESFTPTYAVTLSARHWSPEVLWLGDSLKVDLLPGRNDVVRVSEISLDIDSGEKISVTLGKILPNVILRASEAYERANRNSNSIAQKAKTFIQDEEPAAAAIGDLWTQLTPEV